MMELVTVTIMMEIIVIMTAMMIESDDDSGHNRHSGHRSIQSSKRCILSYEEIYGIVNHLGIF